MGALEQSVQRAIQLQADRRQIRQIISGTATNVGETACDVLRASAPTVYGVRLNAIDDEPGSFVTVYPQEKSNVLVGIIENLKTEAVVLRCSEVEKVKIKIGEQTLLIDKDGFVFNEGKNSGLMNIESVTGWMQKVYSDLQTLKALLASHPVAGNGSPLTLTFNPSVPNPVKGDFEDSKIKH
jgi:hypothetical protein